MKDRDKNNESLYLKYWDVNNLYRCAMSRKLHVDSFKWVENTSEFNKDFINNCNEDSDEEHFIEVYFQNLEKLHNRHNNLPF